MRALHVPHGYSMAGRAVPRSFSGVHQGLGPLRPTGHRGQLPLELDDLPVAGIDRGRPAATFLRGQGGRVKWLSASSRTKAI
jgi:hypothetical protein